LKNNPDKSVLYTVGGLAAILLWSSTIGLVRSMAEKIGYFTSAGLMYACAGVLGLAVIARRPGGFALIRAMSAKYLFGCGALCVLYMVALAVAVGTAVDRWQVVEVGIINYLWPGLTLVFSIPLLGKKCKPWLGIGVAIAFAGVIVAMGHTGGLSWSGFTAHLCANALPYGSALAAAVSWALFSNLSRRWAGDSKGVAMPLFMLFAGIILLCLRIIFREQSQWSPRVGLELGYMILGPTLLAYSMWDFAMRRGNLVLVVTCSYFTPLLSTIITCIYLDIPMGKSLWAGCAMVVAGAALCKLSIYEKELPKAE